VDVSVSSAGYSGSPLARKLGIRAGHRILVVGRPPDLEIELPAGVETHTRAGRTAYDVIVAFAPDRRTLARRSPTLPAQLVVDGGLWVAWPKRSSGVSTDLDENQVRAVGLNAGLVDNKVCAIDPVWSGLRFVVRLRDR
jgi:hypothetical protein